VWHSPRLLNAAADALYCLAAAVAVWIAVEAAAPDRAVVEPHDAPVRDAIEGGLDDR